MVLIRRWCFCIYFSSARSLIKIEKRKKNIWRTEICNRGPHTTNGCNAADSTSNNVTIASSLSKNFYLKYYDSLSMNSKENRCGSDSSKCDKQWTIHSVQCIESSILGWYSQSILFNIRLSALWEKSQKQTISFNTFLYSMHLSPHWWLKFDSKSIARFNVFVM